MRRSNRNKMAAPASSQLSLPGLPGESYEVTAFISKVWKIVEDPAYDRLIGWSEVSATAARILI